MLDPDFCREQMQGRYASHVSALNLVVDELRRQDGRGAVPYVAPDYGGVRAELLCLFQIPGQTAVDTGLLCRENDDSTAEHFAVLLDEAGIEANRVGSGTPVRGPSTVHPRPPTSLPACPHCTGFSPCCPSSRSSC